MKLTEKINCPRCGKIAWLITSSNGRFFATHNDEPNGYYYDTRQEAINSMIASYTGVGQAGCCPQAWNYNVFEDGEPDCATG